ncbi:hypothetical protein LINGRAHAP2_LOCUS11925 [Linum grandiflorum]
MTTSPPPPPPRPPSASASQPTALPAGEPSTPAPAPTFCKPIKTITPKNIKRDGGIPAEKGGWWRS